MSHKSKKDTEALSSLRISKIILPILIGLGVVFYLMYSQLDMDLLREVSWDSHAWFWILMAVILYVIRHLFYAWRLRILTGKLFNWWKSIELIFIWEFASAVSPTSIGGSAVALFLLAQEKLSVAKTVAVVVYSMVIDTLFFLVSLPLIYFLLGPAVLRPKASNFSDLGGYGVTYFSVIAFMMIYGALFYYGIFGNPRHIKRFFLWLSMRKILKRFSRSLRGIANDIGIASAEIKNQPSSFHIKTMISTAGAWITRFLAINCIVIAIIKTTSLDFWNQFLLYGRGKAMHTITQFSPTPGGSGVSEYLFGGFYSDFIPVGIAILAALIWRLITYYPYLIAGAIIIPNWIRGIIIRRKRGEL